mgnify:CR=1 FL=1
MTVVNPTKEEIARVFELQRQHQWDVKASGVEERRAKLARLKDSRRCCRIRRAKMTSTAINSREARRTSQGLPESMLNAAPVLRVPCKARTPGSTTAWASLKTSFGRTRSL